MARRKPDPNRRVSLGRTAVEWIENYLCHGPGDVQGEDLVVVHVLRSGQENTRRGLSLCECSRCSTRTVSTHWRHCASLARIHELAHGLRAPDGASASWNTLYRRLAEFEMELFAHIHLENDVLFPRALREE